MSRQDRKDFDDRLAELNNWQIEQQRKLKAFQEVQRKLLDLQHENVLNGLNTQNFDLRHNSNMNTAKEDETASTLENFSGKEANSIFQLKFPQIKLTEPKASLFKTQNSSSQSNHFCIEPLGNMEENENKPKKFLKRGEGLARFRMTLDDFKSPPKIYKEKKIKTYLNTKPEPKLSSRSNKSVKNNKCNKNSGSKMQVKSGPLPVKIYVPETKPRHCSSGRSFESKAIAHSSKKINNFYPKAPIENLSLKSHSIATEWYNVLKEKEEKLEERINSAVELEAENKKDEKELRIFEILEKKVDDTSFCSNSSFVDKLMEHSMSSTPSKPFTKSKELALPYSKGLKSLRSQFLDEEKFKKLEELERISFEKNEFDETESEEKSSHNGNKTPEIIVLADHDMEKVELDQPLEDEPDVQQEILEPEPPPQPPHKVNKTLLQEYIKDFKKFKFLLAENVHRIEEEPETEPSPKELLTKETEKQLNQHEIALKLQRKGLQDNVKQLLNWECPPRKRQQKRVVKKIKSKPKLEKSKPLKEQNEKIIFNRSLLHERLNELEKEIEIFRKENKNLERLQKECNEEKIKLSKERKEFEKQMEEEKEKLEAKITEEQKKLQKEKTVFEKYCKQIKNQPTRQEREETANLKKEIEKLTETLGTKEARWGAAQARLRNQIKNLEKENSQLKAEIEKYKKLSMKKVSFENDKALNTKIMHAINTELGKLKPTMIKSSKTPNVGRNPSLSARAERDLEEKPIRRIKSAPNVKKQMETDFFAESFNDCDEKALGSVSTDSGIETNGSRYAPMQKVEGLVFHETKILKEVPEESQKESYRSPLFGRMEERIVGKRPTENLTELVVREAIFGDSLNSTSRKIAEVKNRLERLSLLGHSKEGKENHSVKMVKIPDNYSETEEESSSGNEEEEEEEEEEEVKKRDLGIINCSFKKNALGKSDSCSSPYFQKSIIETKIDESGIREKFFEDGSKEICYPNGNVKKIFPGSKIIRMTYYNGDIKETDVEEGSEKYYYAETKTWHTTYKDGLEVLEFPNGQTERRHSDGSTEISFPNGCVRYCDPSGRDEWRFLDGTVIKTNESGHKILLMPNGQKEIHTKEFKRREYPDGTVKILYSDGTQETRYSTGRVRLKDKDGNLVMDSGGIS